AGQPVALPTDQNFTGQQLDANTGLLYYANGTGYGRYYDPSLGRWTQPDPVIPNPGHPQDLNRYSYTRNNPLRYIDPSGHYILIEGEPGTPTEFAVRETRIGVVILHGGTRLPTPVHVAVANYVLTGDIRYLNRVPAEAWPWMNAVLVDVFTALGYEYRGWQGQVWGEIGPVLAGAGTMFIPGSRGKDTPLVKGRFVRETLPPLPEKYQSAFDGEPVIRTLQPGQKLYRAELSNRPVSRWFGTQPTTSLARADRWWNILKYGPRDVMRVYEVTEPVTVYYGRVAGGRGTQILLPLDVKPSEVVRRVGEWPLK
ncbi:MAG TPA: RHS repeat-associated core domain-containing protein, partial [Anaerolineae bacterium]|nr:RHS repeat-associated core domain-containing protein [Anaerolineae bacterium]